MKSFYASLMFLFFAIMPVFAQDQLPSAEDLVAKMQSQLSLTQDQVTAVTPIIEKYVSKRQELHQSMQDGTTDSTIRSQLKQLKADESQELGQFLSLDQLNQWEQMQGRHKHSSDEDGKENNGKE